MNKEEVPPCHFCGTRHGLIRPGRTTPFRCEWTVEDGQTRLACFRCYCRMWTRARRGVTAVGGSIRRSVYAPDVNKIIVNRKCSLCDDVLGDYRRFRLPAPWDPTYDLCEACHSWARRKSEFVKNAERLESLRSERKRTKSNYAERVGDKCRCTW